MATSKNIIQKEKAQLNKFKKVVANIIHNIGYHTIAKSMPRMKASELEKNVMFVINKEIAVGKGCTHLTNPITRIRTKNPMRSKYLKARDMLKEAIRRIKVLENNLKKS